MGALDYLTNLKLHNGLQYLQEIPGFNGCDDGHYKGITGYRCYRVYHLTIFIQRVHRRSSCRTSLQYATPHVSGADIAPQRTVPRAEPRLWKKMHFWAGPSIQMTFDWKRGARLGEASNPGPVVELLATNPTSLTDKTRHFAEMTYHVAMLSEVAATADVQPRNP